MRGLHYAGVFAGRRSAAALQTRCRTLLRTPVRIKDYIVRWRDVEPADRSRLGQTAASTSWASTRFWADASASRGHFRVVLRTRSSAEYDAFLPGGQRFAVASRALDALAPSHLDWQLELELDERQIEGSRLDGAPALV
jgi:type VI secretion system protein ImpH